MGNNAFLFTVVLLTLLVGCKTDESAEVSYELEGNWEIHEAFRNDEVTTTLEDGYFKFVDSTMETNILGSPIVGSFSLEGSAFSHNSSLPAKYSISKYSQNSMELETKIRGFEFLFKLTKATDSIPEN